MQVSDQMQGQPVQREQQQLQQQPAVLPQQFLEDPGTFLQTLASLAPSPDGLKMLAGPLAKWFVNAAATAEAVADPTHVVNEASLVDMHAAFQVGPLFLAAASNQLQYSLANVSSGGEAGAVSAAPNNHHQPLSVKQEMAQTKNQFEVLNAVGCVASSLCPDRSAISPILPTLSKLMVHSQNAAAQVMDEEESSGLTAGGKGKKGSSMNKGGRGRQQGNVGAGEMGIGSIASALFGPGATAGSLEEVASAAAQSLGGSKAQGTSKRFPPLQQASVEFLQCAMAAEQYRYAARMIEGTWPRPTSTVSVKTVLRYFYLRGMIHLGCQDYLQAHRCWWACLSVPTASDSSDACSSIAVAAWKKMILVQPLINHRCNRMMLAGKSASNKTTPILPGCASKGLVKTITTNDKSCANYSLVCDLTNKGDVKYLNSILSPSSLVGDGENTNMEDVDGSGGAVMALPSSRGEKNLSVYDVLVTDGNLGLAQECWKQARLNQIWQMSQLFSVVSFEQLARRLGIPVEEVHGRLKEASASNTKSRGSTRTVQFHLEQSPSGGETMTGSTMVVFDENEDNKSGDASSPAGSLTTQLSDFEQWMHLLDRIQQLDVAIATKPKYHALTKREGRGSISTGSSGLRGGESSAGMSTFADMDSVLGANPME